MGKTNPPKKRKKKKKVLVDINTLKPWKSDEKIEDAYDTFILPSLLYDINIVSTVESKDYEMSLLNSIEYQQHIFTEL